jgi:hypothetical protein
MQRQLARLLVALIILGVVIGVLTGAAAAQESAPKCSEVDYTNNDMDGYLDVDSVDELQCIRENDLANNYELTGDIDASETSEWEFKPIGNSSHPFTGTFKGNNHAISGLNITRKQNNTALFGVVKNGTVKSVALEGPTIRGQENVGGLVGTNNESSVESVTLTNGNITGGRAVGGIVGWNLNGSVNKSETDAEVTGQVGVGGAVGATVGSSGTLTDVSASGIVIGSGDRVSDTDVSSIYGIGGLVGANGVLSSGNLAEINREEAPGSTLKHVEATSDVTIKNIANRSVSDGEDPGSAGVGGLTGLNYLGTITDATASGDITIEGAKGTYDAFLLGGLAGANLGEISNASASGAVNTRGDSVLLQFVGGLIGGVADFGELPESNSDSGTVKQVTASGDVVGTRYVGGLVGFNGGLGPALSGTSIKNATASGRVKVNLNKNLDSLNIQPEGSGAAGGLIGAQSGGTVTQTAAAGAVSAPESEFVGGLIGLNGQSQSSEIFVNKSYAIGPVTGGNKTGGLIGENLGTIEETYAAGTVSGKNDVGGLAGVNSGQINGSYWDNSSSGTNQSDAFSANPGDDNNTQALQTEQMQGVTPSGDNGTMMAFEFKQDVENGETWITVAAGEEINPTPAEDGYPILEGLAPTDQLDAQGIEEADPVAARLGLAITDTNAPLEAGETLTVTARAVSIGGFAGTESVTLETEAATATATESVTVSAGGRTTTTLSVATAPEQPPDEYPVTVEASDSRAQTTVSITEQTAPTVSDYANDENIVTTDGLTEGISDWRADEIETPLLLDVIDAWRSGTPVS